LSFISFCLSFGIVISLLFSFRISLKFGFFLSF